MFRILAAFVLTLVHLSGHANEAMSSLEVSTNRNGFDYSSIDLPTPDPNLCRKACDEDEICQAFTYVHPGIQGNLARCWLKFAANQPESAGCCISGVKPITRNLGWMRSAPDYKNFTLPVGSRPADCEAACVQELKCKGFSFMFSHHNTTTPHCWLHETVGYPFPREFHFSGTVR